MPVSGLLSVNFDEVVNEDVLFTFTNTTGSNLVFITLKSQVIGLIF